ncbi:hypothetical protein C8Q72DRAFT_891972 [Fomitopsis betulina]|nr:hypothetical protein C8Q72DRAFT_891972 [Fomitopsis betulina]
MQPLDITVFSSVTDAWYKHCSDLIDHGQKVTHYNIIQEYMEAHKVIAPELIRKAFEKTGIYLLNPYVFSDEDFGPSMASSSMAHVPASFPNDTPLLPMSFTSQPGDSDLGTSDDEYVSSPVNTMHATLPSTTVTTPYDSTLAKFTYLTVHNLLNDNVSIVLTTRVTNAKTMMLLNFYHFRHYLIRLA